MRKNARPPEERTSKLLRDFMKEQKIPMRVRINQSSPNQPTIWISASLKLTSRLWRELTSPISSICVWTSAHSSKLKARIISKWMSRKLSLELSKRCKISTAIASTRKPVLRKQQKGPPLFRLNHSPQVLEIASPRLEVSQTNRTSQTKLSPRLRKRHRNSKCYFRLQSLRISTLWCSSRISQMMRLLTSFWMKQAGKNKKFSS